LKNKKEEEKENVFFFFFFLEDFPEKVFTTAKKYNIIMP